MASVLEQLQVRYKGRTVEASSQEVVTNLTYIGSKELCEEAMYGPLAVGMQTEDGTIETVTMTQDEGPFWLLNVRATTLANADMSATGTGYGPTRSELSTTTISRPIEQLKNYKKHWNYNLYTCQSYAEYPTGSPLPAWWATDDANTDSTQTSGNISKWAWAQRRSDLVPLQAKAKDVKSADGWRRAKAMTKPRSGFSRLCSLYIDGNSKTFDKGKSSLDTCKESRKNSRTLERRLRCE